MTVDEIIQETRNWPQSQLNDLIQALATYAHLQHEEFPKPDTEAVARFKEFAKKIDAIWAGSNVEYTNEDIVNLIRQSRGDRP